MVSNVDLYVSFDANLNKQLNKQLSYQSDSDVLTRIYLHCNEYIT